MGCREKRGRVQGLGLGAWGVGLGVGGVRFGVQGSGFRVWGLGFRAEAPSGAQPVAVQRRPNLLAIGEDKEGGAVPGLLEARVIVVEVRDLLLVLQLRLVLVGLPTPFSQF